MGGNKERGVTKKVEGRRLKKRVATSRRRKLLKGKDIRAHIANIKQGSFIKKIILSQILLNFLRFKIKIKKYLKSITIGHTPPPSP